MSNEGLKTVPPVAGHNSPKILKREDFPQPLGPVIIKCMPGEISKLILGINTSELGDKIGTSLNMI